MKLRHIGVSSTSRRQLSAIKKRSEMIEILLFYTVISDELTPLCRFARCDEKSAQHEKYWGV